MRSFWLSVAALSALSQPAPANDLGPVSDVKVFGVLQLDYARVSSENADYKLDDIEPRRGRIGLKGNFGDGGKFKAELDLDTPRDLQFIDLYASYPLGDSITLKVGQFKTPNSFDEQTSSKFVSTLERSAFTDVFQLGRGVGVGLIQSGKRHTLTLGAYGRDIEDKVFTGYYVGGRATYEPVHNDELRLHTGVSFRYRDLDDDQSLFRYAQKPVAGSAGRIISAGRIGESDLFIGAEAMLLKNEFWAGGELGVLTANCPACTDDPAFAGGYVEIGKFFGGKRIMKSGRFDRPEIYRDFRSGGPGAFSLVAKYDVFDLENASINGGEYRSLTVGADWWPTTHTRLGVNAFLVDADFGNIVSGLDPAFAAAILAGIRNEDAKGVLIRAQFDF